MSHPGLPSRNCSSATAGKGTNLPGSAQEPTWDPLCSRERKTHFWDRLCPRRGGECPPPEGPFLKDSSVKHPPQTAGSGQHKPGQGQEGRRKAVPNSS